MDDVPAATAETDTGDRGDGGGCALAARRGAPAAGASAPRSPGTVPAAATNTAAGAARSAAADALGAGASRAAAPAGRSRPGRRASWRGGESRRREALRDAIPR